MIASALRYETLFSILSVPPQPIAAPTRAEFPPLSGADIAGMVQGEKVGGDLYHFLRANRCRVIFGMLDVAGRHEENHGIVEAARRTFQEVGMQKFAYEEINEADAMMELCLELNLSIRKAAAGVRSCAAFLGCYNEELGTICYANAGHTPGCCATLRASLNCRRQDCRWDCFRRPPTKRRRPPCKRELLCCWFRAA